MRKHLPVYYHSADYAKEYHETVEYNASYRLNVECRNAICEAIDEHYKNNSLDEAGAHNIIERFGYERSMVILANTVRQKDWDGRFSPDNRKWAETVPAPCDMLGERGRRFMIDKVHPGLVNLFIDQVRREYERTYGRRSIRAALIENAAQGAAEPKPKPRKKSEQSL